MSFLQNIFGKKETPISSYEDFWDWFKLNEKAFFDIVKTRTNVEKGFFDKLSAKLGELKTGFFYLTGMYDENTVELVLTADGNLNNIVFVEELVNAAPVLKNWKFTALKPAVEIGDFSIEMQGYKFNSDNISFYSNDNEEHPDKIEIVIIHHDYNKENELPITNGTYIYLDNYLGELDFAMKIDEVKFMGKTEAKKELIPINKLKDFLTWREKEFIEKYDEIRYDTANDEFSILEAVSKNGNKLIATINTKLLNWENKPSHPWIAVLTLKFKGKNNGGMPDKKNYELLNKIEDGILIKLNDKDGYLNIGRQTADGERIVYFACKDFRKPSKVFFDVEKSNSNDFKISYDIYKDKYWESLEYFRKN